MFLVSLEKVSAMRRRRKQGIIEKAVENLKWNKGEERKAEEKWLRCVGRE